MTEMPTEAATTPIPAATSSPSHRHAAEPAGVSTGSCELRRPRRAPLLQTPPEIVPRRQLSNENAHAFFTQLNPRCCRTASVASLDGWRVYGKTAAWIDSGHDVIGNNRRCYESFVSRCISPSTTALLSLTCRLSIRRCHGSVIRRTRVTMMTREVTRC